MIRDNTRKTMDELNVLRLQRARHLRELEFEAQKEADDTMFVLLYTIIGAAATILVVVLYLWNWQPWH